MTQHISLEDLEKYLKRTLSAGELVSFDVHLTECDLCFEKTAHLRSEQAPVISLHDTPTSDVSRDEHISYVQLASYVDGEMDEVDKEIVDVHRRVCDDCAGQLAELFQLRATLELDAGPAKSRTISTGRSSFSNLWNRITTSPFLKFAAPAFAILLLGMIIWSAWFLTRRPPNEVAEVVDLPVNTPATNAESGDVNSEIEGRPNSNSHLPQPVISLADGGTRIEIDATGNLKGLNAPQFESRVRSALTTQNIEIPSAARELRSRSGVLMSDGQPGAPFALTTPVGKVVQTDRPQFRWRPMKDAESYVVTIYDANFNKVVGSPTLRQPSWTSAIRLKRGIVYQWQVTAVKDGQEIKSPVRPAPDARFKVLDAAAVKDIESAKRRAGNSHLLLGILYANAGLINEAEREFQALLQKNPNSDVAKGLLNKVRAAR